MEKYLLKFSDLIFNDGGFDKLRSELDDLEKHLKDMAKNLKGVINLNDVFNVENLRKFEEELAELRKAFKKVEESRESVEKVEEEYLKTLKKSRDGQEDQIDILTELNDRLTEQREEIKSLNTQVKLGLKTEKEVSKERTKTILKIKQIQKEVRKHQKEVIESNEVSKDEQKLIKAKLVLEDKQVKSLKEVRERISALRIVVQSLDLEEEADKIAEFNNEIDDLTSILEENSDKFIKSKINIGNYEEAIVNALGQTSLFTTNIGILDGAISSLVKALTASGEELEELQKSLDKNNDGIKRLTIAFGRLNKVLKASIIGLVLVSLAGLASLFGDTRAGAIRLEKIMKTLNNTFAAFGQIVRVGFSGASESFDSVIKQGKALIDVIVNLNTFNFKDAKKAFKSFVFEFEENASSVKKRLKDLFDAIESGVEGVVQGLENIENSFRIQDTIRGLERELAKLTGEFDLLQQVADDSTRTLLDQLEGNKRALAVSEQIAKREVAIERLRLEEVNERLKQNIKVNIEEEKRINLALKGVPFAEKTLELAKLRGAQLEISNALLEEQQSAVLALTQAENQRDLTFAENAQKRREIERDIFEQNLDLLIDLIDTEKNLSEQQVNDASKNFQDRLKEFNRFILVFKDTSQKQLEEFNLLAEKNAKILRERLDIGGLTSAQIKDIEDQLSKLDNIDLKVNFTDDDVQVFNNGVELSLENIVALNKELQSLGLAEIPINRFREFVTEGRNGLRDFKELNKELTLTGIKVNELFNNAAVDRVELEAIDELILKTRELRDIDLGAVSKKERNRISKELEDIEKERADIEKRFAQKRDDNRLDAINEELKTVDEGSTRGLELIRERNALEKKIRDDSFKSGSESLNKDLKEQERLYKEFANKITKIIDLIAQAFVDNAKKQTEAARNSLSDQQQATDTQRSRAEAGLQNTLAFEQRELGKRESELIKRQKREAQIQKLQSFWNAYNANLKALKSDEDSSVAISKTLRDVALIEGITAAIGSFEKGGIVGRDGFDHVRTSSQGITQGRSHNMKNGVLAYHQGGEGFFSREDVAAIGGESAFYKLKQAAASGVLNTNFFTPQSETFVRSLPSKRGVNEGLVNEVRELKKIISNQPHSTSIVGEVTDQFFEVIDKTVKGNKTKRTITRIKKNRL